jgi:Carboxypeptidase regulatory-like domain
MRGNMDHSAGVNGFIFKPCIRATNNSTTGRIEGIVTDTSKVNLADAKIWVKQDTIISTTFTGISGNYAFIGVPAGTYSIFATKENYDTVSYTGIKVIEGNRTIRNFTLTKK